MRDRLGHLLSDRQDGDEPRPSPGYLGLRGEEYLSDCAPKREEKLLAPSRKPGSPTNCPPSTNEPPRGATHPYARPSTSVQH